MKHAKIYDPKDRPEWLRLLLMFGAGFLFLLVVGGVGLALYALIGKTGVLSVWVGICLIAVSVGIGQLLLWNKI